METRPVCTVIGLMSGTSLDGIDAALLRTDGESHAEPLDFLSTPYEEGLREDLRRCLGHAGFDDFVRDVERRMTLAHAAVVRDLLARAETPPTLIGFHGQTIFHDPANGRTLQIGDGALLARETGIPVVNDFRRADMEAGGEGAPFLPLYHAARAETLEKPVAILNIGGVANVTYLGPEGCILAFDTGPGNALIDDCVKKQTGAHYDRDGALAAAGTPDEKRLQVWLAHPYFDRTPPKSLDRNAWLPFSSSDGVEEGVSTLTAFTVRAIAKARDHFPSPPLAWYVTGGGRHNKTMMRWLSETLDTKVRPVEDLGWNGDALEAEGFAYLAARSRAGLPLSLPTTTGVKTPTTGGVFHPCV
ncbi:MAG: anhydro-N-acetylmuramic acid kinase [Alphaproteobacteria bacterium]|nr:anhydro-N-acetylmuramic acid kinase [Alphaproteobacteria bacterium]